MRQVEYYVNMTVRGAVGSRHGLFHTLLELVHRMSEFLQPLNLQTGLRSDDRQARPGGLGGIGNQAIGFGNLGAQMRHLLGDDPEGAARTSQPRRFDLGVERDYSSLTC